MESTTFSLLGKTLTILRYYGRPGVDGLDSRIRSEESSDRTAAAIGRRIGIRSNNMHRHLTNLKRDGEVEPIGGSLRRGCRWRITLRGVRSAARLWGEDLPRRVIIGGAKIRTDGLMTVWREVCGVEVTPEALISLVVMKGWLPFLHSIKQNRQVVRPDYNPFGFLLANSEREPWEAAAVLMGTALRAVFLDRRNHKDPEVDASAALYPLVLIATDKDLMLDAIIDGAVSIGSPTKDLAAVLDVLGGPETPDRDTRTAALGALLRFERRERGRA